MRTQGIEVFDRIIGNALRVGYPRKDHGRRARIAKGITVLFALGQRVGSQGIGGPWFVDHRDLLPENFCQLVHKQPSVDIPSPACRNRNDQLNGSTGVRLSLNSRNSNTDSVNHQKQNSGQNNFVHRALL